MILQIKKFVKRNEILRRLLLPIVDKSILFKLHTKFNFTFSFKLVNGKKIKFYPKGQIAFGLFTNKFELKELEIFQNLLKKGMTVVDAGANIGLYSLVASKIVGDSGKVFSYEPSFETFQRLKKNIEINNVSNIFLTNCGLGETEDEVLILRQDIGTKDAERYIMPKNYVADEKLINVKEINIKEEIRIDTLDNNLKKNQINKIDFLKIDTEGFEYYILLGAKKILLSSPEIIMLMECTTLGTTRANTTQKKVFDLLGALGFKIFYWADVKNEWCDDNEGIYNSGVVWVCKSKDQLIAKN
jgi:FkbM family methyltransferase